MSTLHVENLKGLSSGGNANKIIVPSGQTFVPSVGQIIQKAYHSWNSEATNSSETFADVSGSSFSFTPKLSTSRLFITATYQFNPYSSGFYAGGMVRIVHDGTALDYVDAKYEAYMQQQSSGTSCNFHLRQTKCITVASGNTNARTIKLQMAKYASGTTAVRFNQSDAYYSTIVVEEVTQ